jgi:alpha-L-rhamnosidase
MPSVRLNNTIQESWTVQPDSQDQWSHSAIAPLSVAHLCVVGLKPLAPGFRQAQLRPQLGNLEGFELTSYTGQGPLHFKTEGKKGARHVSITVPKGCACDLILRAEEKVALKTGGNAPLGYRRYMLRSDSENALTLRVT